MAMLVEVEGEFIQVKMRACQNCERPPLALGAVILPDPMQCDKAQNVESSIY